MTDAEVIAAIRANHLQANISDYDPAVVCWDRATVDPGGSSLFGHGPYLHVPIDLLGEWPIIRVHAPARLRRKLAKRWIRMKADPKVSA